MLAGGDYSDVVQVLLLYCGYLLLILGGIEVFYRRCRLVPSLIKKKLITASDGRFFGRCNLSKVMAGSTRLTLAGCLCAHFPRYSLACNPLTLWRNPYAFTALMDDGTVQAWGASNSGGSVPADLKVVQTIGVKLVFGTTQFYADSTSAHHYPCPHNSYGPGFPSCTSCPSGSTQPIGRPGILQL